MDLTREACVQKIWTVAEIEAMTPAQQDALFETSIVWNLDDAPAELVARVRARIEARIAAQELRDAS
jgi:hypothetical protein